jgi:Na+/pantothenate symporter
MRPPAGIVGLTVLSGSIYAACFAPAVLLGLFWRGGNGGAVLGSFAAGLLVLLVWPLMPIAALIHQVFPAIAAALLVYLVLARRGGPVGSVTLDQLFAD